MGGGSEFFKKIIFFPVFSPLSSTFLIEGMLRSKVDKSTQKPQAILDFEGGAVVQAVSKCPSLSSSLSHPTSPQTIVLLSLVDLQEEHKLTVISNSKLHLDSEKH